MRAIKLIVIHCSASQNGDARITLSDIDRWHRDRGWSGGVGYHYVIECDGYLAFGRPEEEIGAHVAGSNASSIGICMIGTDRFSREQWVALRQIVQGLMHKYPEAKVLGHRDFSPDLNGNGIIEPWEYFKSCPGFDVKEWLEYGMEPVDANIYPEPRRPDEIVM